MNKRMLLDSWQPRNVGNGIVFARHAILACGQSHEELESSLAFLRVQKVAHVHIVYIHHVGEFRCRRITESITESIDSSRNP